MNKTYIIEYKICSDNIRKSEHKINVKNCQSELAAKIKLGEYLKKKHGKSVQIEITKCEEDLFSVFGEIFGQGKSNPFSNINK